MAPSTPLGLSEPRSQAATPMNTATAAPTPRPVAQVAGVHPSTARALKGTQRLSRPRMPSASAQVATTAHSRASGTRGMLGASPGSHVSAASTARKVPASMASEPSRLLRSPPSVS